jgi:hypothetical protein
MVTKEKEVMIGAATLSNEPFTPQQSVISDEQYAEMERKQSERRFFMTGRKRNDDSSSLITRNDIRTCMVLDKDQYDKIREIALRETMTIKDLTNMMFQLAIDQYEKKHGVVVPRTESVARKSIF